jgi:hypothetical protein
MPVLAGRPLVGQAGHNRTLAGLQDSQAGPGLPGMDSLRHKIRQESVTPNGFEDMPPDDQENGG